MRDTIRLIFAEGQRFTQVAGNNDSESRFLGHSNTVNFLRGTAALEKQCSVYSLIALSGVELVKKLKRAHSQSPILFFLFFFLFIQNWINTSTKLRTFERFRNILCSQFVHEAESISIESCIHRS